MTRTYPIYKDSELPWVGKVPSHWGIKPVLAVAKERNERNQGLIESNLLSLSYGKIVRKDINSSEGLLPESFETYQIVRTGDIVFRLTDLQNDKRSLRTALVREDGIITSAYLALTFFSLLPSFAAKLFRSYDLSKVFYSMGGGLRQSMKFADIRRLPVIVPPLAEQRAIAAFLDRETGKIDAAVEEQRRLIALLKEKRQAVISHAVTKGLNPDAPMKSSGIDWLGEIPEHWELQKLKRLGQAIIGLTYTPEDVVDEGGTLVLRSSNIQNGRIVFDDNVFVERSIPEELRTRTGDILICSRNGSRGLIGKNAKIDESAKGITFGAFTTLFRGPYNAFLSWVFNSRLFEFQSGSYLTSTINQLTIGSLKSFEVPLPPPEEQLEIASYLIEETQKLDSLISETETAIDLLQERRSALISAAVTGKIDVRGEVAGQQGEQSFEGIEAGVGA